MIFITGFPGFLATELMLRMEKQNPNTHFLCLVQTKFLPLAEKQKQKFHSAKLDLIAGDITEDRLGILSSTDCSSISEIFHFAAIYDLSVSKALASKINIEGTRQVLDFANALPQLKRLHYVSTCYVSGRYDGLFLESDLELGQNFNNFYESTKYEAEILVRSAMKNGLHATIYRPSVVVGNSETGETQKFDGPYFILQWLLRQPKIAILPRLFHPAKFRINVVPSDFVLDALSYLSQLPHSIGKTYQLADPEPLTIQQMIQCLGKASGRKVISIGLPKEFAKLAVGSLPGLEKWLGIPKAALDYFAQPTEYSTKDTLRDLEGSGISCPDFRTYAPKLVAFMKANPRLRSQALA